MAPERSREGLDPFYLWWVAENGSPPLPHQGETFRFARAAWFASRAQLRDELAASGRHRIESSGRPLLACAARPDRGTGA